MCRLLIFFFNDTATTEIYTLSLHDALPISKFRSAGPVQWVKVEVAEEGKLEYPEKNPRESD